MAHRNTGRINADKFLHITARVNNLLLITVTCKSEEKVMDKNTSRTDIQWSNSATCGGRHHYPSSSSVVNKCTLRETMRL